MKKIALLLTLITAISLSVFSAEEVSVSAPKDSMGMMAAFMGVSDTSGDSASVGEIGGGETSAPAAAPSAAPTVVVVPTITTTVTNNNVTISTPYSYK